LETQLSLEEQFEATAVTKATVAPGLGYPANRVELSPEPTGWQHTLDSGEVINVSRETTR
jgi:hypothetical protein